MIDTANPPLCPICYEPLTTEGKCLYQEEHDTFERAEEEALVTFWRDEWPEEGQVGDDAGHSPVGHAIHVLRRLRGEVTALREALAAAELKASERWDQFRDRERDTALLRIENEVQAENDRCVDAMLKALNGILRRKKE